MGGKSSPKAPDFTKAAEMTAESSRENTTAQTYANRPTQNTPWGTTSWENQAGIDPATGQKVTQWTQNVTLDPNSQRALDAQQGLQTGRSELALDQLGRIQQQYGPEIDYSKFADKGDAVTAGNVRGKLGGADAYMSKAGDALMAQFNDRMQPQFQQDQAQQDAILRARGLKPGDEAYDNALKDMRQGQSDQFNQAMYQAQQLAGSEAQRMQGMDSNQLQAFNQAIKDNLGIDLDLSKFADYQRGRDVTEEQQRRGWSLNEANAIGSGQQVAMPTMPTFQGANRSETTQYGQAAGQQYGAAMDAFNAEQQAIAGMAGAITSPFSLRIPS